jgi:uncharacterized protein YeaO (DUF488 family)
MAARRRRARSDRPRIRIKRAYAPAARSDGHRVLIDGLWPRGLTKDAVHVHAWAKELAASARLRRWFGHDPARWTDFARRYREELRTPAARRTLADLARRAAEGPVTIVYAARDEAHNNAVVIRDEVTRRWRSRRGASRVRRRSAGTS